ncbi:beta-galactosidase trimerization domain-containing protein [Novosphingobium resinovorum]|uniref:beta-galactosidase trimerization domain-containing protein n=1 Tax=Novosphingobium resinovorum TaxID=158500 RepID=UPI002ECFC116|nr:beta-galactosidase trimerization domain-containing protein [Novosphingobium resinovorum]
MFGGMVGYVANGSGDIPNGRIYGLRAYGGSNAALNSAYAAAGLTGLTLNDDGTAARLYDNATDDGFDTTPYNNLQSGLERYMANSFAHFEFSDAATLYGEFHYSHNKMAMQIAPANYNAPLLVDVNNPYLSPEMQKVLGLLDAAETNTTTVTHGVTQFTNTPNDGLALINFQSVWTTSIQPDVAGQSHLDHCIRWYAALRRLGLDVDIVRPGAPLAGYKLAVVPTLAIVGPAALAALAGVDGLLVIGPRSGSKTGDFAIPAQFAPGTFLLGGKAVPAHGVSAWRTPSRPRQGNERGL